MLQGSDRKMNTHDRTQFLSICACLFQFFYLYIVCLILFCIFKSDMPKIFCSIHINVSAYRDTYYMYIIYSCSDPFNLDLSYVPQDKTWVWVRRSFPFRMARPDISNVLVSESVILIELTVLTLYIGLLHPATVTTRRLSYV